MLKKIIIASTMGLFLCVPTVFAAQGILPDESNRGADASCNSYLAEPGHQNNNCGDYSLDDIMSIAIIVANWILGVVGSVSLLFFIYGGFTWILSGGSSEAVQKGKQIILGSIIGLVIVFSSYLIIQFSLQALGIEGAGTGVWQKLGWFTG